MQITWPDDTMNSLSQFLYDYSHMTVAWLINCAHVLKYTVKDRDKLDLY